MLKQNLKKGILEMFDKKRFKEIIAEKDAMSWADHEDYERMSKLWREMIDLAIESDDTFKDFLKYMYEEMTESEYSYLSEVSDEISQEKPSYEFIEAYKFLAEKYPEETKRFDILDFIDVAEGFVEMALGERKA